MVRYSCDMCGRDLSLIAGGRFTVRIETLAIAESSCDDLTDDDLDADHLEEIGELLSREEELPEAPPSGRSFAFDLCRACHEKFAANPLNVQLPKFDFSGN